MSKKTTSEQRRLRRLQKLEDALGAPIKACRDNEKALNMAFEIRHTALAMLTMKVIKNDMKGTGALSNLSKDMQYLIGAIQERAIKVQIQGMDTEEALDARNQIRQMADSPAFSEDIDKYQEALLKSFVENPSKAKESYGSA